jgi:hypothetical protein
MVSGRHRERNVASLLRRLYMVKPRRISLSRSGMMYKPSGIISESVCGDRTAATCDARGVGVKLGTRFRCALASSSCGSCVCNDDGSCCLTILPSASRFLLFLYMWKWDDVGRCKWQLTKETRFNEDTRDKRKEPYIGKRISIVTCFYPII